MNLRELAEKATPGPWHVNKNRDVCHKPGKWEITLTSGDQDGYKMLSMQQVVPGSPVDRTLKQLVIEGLKASQGNGIEPRLEGRICSADRPDQPCLAVADR